MMEKNLKIAIVTESRFSHEPEVTGFMMTKDSQKRGSIALFVPGSARYRCRTSLITSHKRQSLN